MNVQHIHTLALAAVLVGLPLVGCDSSTDSGGSDMDQLAAMLDQTKEQPAQEKTEPAPKPQPPAEPQEVTAHTPQAGQKVRRVGGYLGTTLYARFYAENKMAFLSMQKTLDLYQAERGYYPRSHEEFMEKIIKEGMIDLPELPDGLEYIYDPSDHTLKYRPIPAEGEEPAEPREIEP